MVILNFLYNFFKYQRYLIFANKYSGLRLRSSLTVSTPDFLSSSAYSLPIPFTRNKSAIFTREHGFISNLNDLAGKSFAFVDRKSTSGYIVPKVMMQEAGVSLDDLASYQFHNYHEDVVKAVLNGEADAGAVMENVAMDNVDKGVKLLSVSDEFPAFVVCASSDTDDAVISDLFDALAGLDGGGPEALRVINSIGFKITGFDKVSDLDFEGVRGLVSRAGGPDA